MSTHLGCYPLHADKIICRKCGQTGQLVWEDVPHVNGMTKELTRIEGQFFERLSKQEPFPIELVCNGCGAAQPE